MRICIVSHEHPPFRGGGIGTYAWTASRALAQRGHEVHVIANAWTADGDAPAARTDVSEVAAAPRVHRIDLLSTSYRPRPPFDGSADRHGLVLRDWETSVAWSALAADRLRELHAAAPFDVVEFPDAFAEGYVALRRRDAGIAGYDVPMTVTLHGPMHDMARLNLDDPSARWLANRIAAEEDAIRRADRVSSPSDAMRRLVAPRHGGERFLARCDVVRNPLELGAAPAGAGCSAAGEREIVCVGRLEPRKGPRTLVDAAVRLLAEVPGVRVRFIGADRRAGEVPGGMRAFLEGRIPAELRDRIVFAGGMERADALAACAAAAISVHPAPWDNFPYACIEAMAVGACVVASDGGGHAEIVEDGVSGLVVPAGDASALASALRRLLDDPALAARLRAAAPSRAAGLCDPALRAADREAHYVRTIEAFRRRGAASPVRAFRRRSVAVLVTGGDEAASRATADAVAATAHRADVRVTTLVRPTPEDLAAWAGGLHAARVRFAAVLRAGDRPSDDWLDVMVWALERDRGAAWAAAWHEVRSSSRPAAFAGLDFELPRDLRHPAAPPFALVRVRDLLRPGAADPLVPEAWREWDAAVALAGLGRRGVVVPVWCGSAVPAAERRLTRDVRLRGLRTFAARRVPDLARHGLTDWITPLADAEAAHPPWQPGKEALPIRALRRAADLVDPRRTLREAVWRALRRRR